MEVFESVLIMLFIVLLSNILNRFIPTIAIPLIQVGLGVILAVFTSFHFFELSSEFFMLLFLAPLLFNEGVVVDKKALWKAKKAITMLSIVLVFVTVGLLGSVIHWLIPTMPLAGSFALAAALAPTDAVAVGALAQKVKIPHKMMNTLEGEALINDASGLVSFQFAVAALLTGTFSIAQAGFSFVLISLGGVVIGIVLSLLVILVVHWLRNLGIENNISFILLEILLPFGVFIVAEHFHANGILAVVSAGLVYSISYKKVNADIAQLHLLSKNTWSVFTFSLNGLVFVLLGLQLPNAIHAVWKNNNISNVTLVFYVLIITVILLGIRFLCFGLFKNFEKNSELPKQDQLKQTALYTISGVRGTITLVSALSLPVVLGNGDLFLERELLISIAGGVIITTLLLANFAMPLFAEKNEKVDNVIDHQKEKEILRNVIKQLDKQTTIENQGAIAKVIDIYNDRILNLSKNQEDSDKLDQLKELILKWQYADTLKQLHDKEINLQVAFRHIRRLNKLLYHLTRDESYRGNIFYGKLIRQKLKLETFVPLSYSEKRQQRRYLKESNWNYIMKKLDELDQEEFSPEMIAFYQSRYSRKNRYLNKDSFDSTDEWLEYAIQIERDSVQQAFELGDMTRSEVKVYRENLIAIESTIQFGD
ncbi:MULTISPECIES: sodium:proton antiporter [Vagococcus]|uniref:Na+/H+ antiporter n=1 Tax=Vagococcus fluvialis bH819 TaxID=1255619 RepID=A0A1X6WLB6_9ENTE|nr:MULTISPECIES: sodium:proton antiporter [Vagococcus]SLM85050.1 Na+/H+ antiporter [Vagococcus fluvialis bH819]HCM88534.1 sodium:proton antiporter [Vagococcus sp.]